MHLLIIQSQLPYANHSAEIGLDVALAAPTGFSQMSLLLRDQAIEQLRPRQTPKTHADFTRQYRLLELYDAGPIYIDAAALVQHTLTVDELIAPVIALAPTDVQQLLRSADLIWNF